MIHGVEVLADQSVGSRVTADRIVHPCASCPLQSEHRAPNASFIPAWDNLNINGTKNVRQFTGAHTTSSPLSTCPASPRPLAPSEAPGPPRKAASATTLDQLEAMVCSRLRNIHSQPEPISAILGQTDLTLDPLSPYTLAFRPLWLMTGRRARERLLNRLSGWVRH